MMRSPRTQLLRSRQRSRPCFRTSRRQWPPLPRFRRRQVVHQLEGTALDEDDLLGGAGAKVRGHALLRTAVDSLTGAINVSIAVATSTADRIAQNSRR